MLKKFFPTNQIALRTRQAALLLMLFAATCSASHLRAQSSTTPTPAPTQNTPDQKSPQKKIPTVITNVLVQAQTANGYLPETVNIGNLDGVPLQQLPSSALVVTRDLLTDQQSRVLADVVKNDASIGEDYAPVGYYGVFQIRGIPIDLATGLEINGLTIAGEQDVPLENKERVEFLKGIAGLESGVAAAAGLINYTTKRAAIVHTIDLATDHRGSAYAATDLGWLWGAHKKFGLRSNLGGERIASYVNGADGWRGLGTAAFDWHINAHTLWTNDFEYQHKVERSVSGYQLLGGTTVPDLSLIAPSAMLGFQSWSKPNTFDAFNASSRIDFDLPRNWRAFIAAGLSHSLIDDNVIYAYGYWEGTTPSWFFGPNGEYDIYDYRDPNELRVNKKLEAIMTGSLKWGPVTHHISGGAELFTRTVSQPGYYTVDQPSTDIIQDGSVYYQIGIEHIYQPNIAFAVESPYEQAGPQRLYIDHHDASLVVQDRLELPHHIQLIAGGRLDSMRDHNYSVNAKTPLSPDPVTGLEVPTPPFNSDKTLWLPNYAATYSPRKDLTLYANYAVMLSLGPQAPWWAANGSVYLSPFYTRQAEAGAKLTIDDKLLVTMALFRMRTPFYYVNTDTFLFAADGHETHQGLELSSEGKLAKWARFSASLAWMRAISNDSQTPAYNDKEIINQPHLHATLFADLAIPQLRGLHLMPGWSYTGAKAALRDDTVNVPGYNLWNLGARYTLGGENGKLSFRLYADNIADKRYWKDTGANYGDTFLHLGAPTTVRLSAQYRF